MQVQLRVKSDTFKPADNLLLSQAFQIVSIHCREPVAIVVENGERLVQAAVDVEAFEADFATLPEETRNSLAKQYIFVWQRNCY